MQPHPQPPQKARVYQALLTRRYLTTKVMPLLAIIAVMLCTAMVLIVWSIMGGFLVMLLSAGRTLMGDVAITWPTSGFAYYEDLVARLERDPMVAGAAPAIETGGTLVLPDNRIQNLRIVGIDGPSYAIVTGYDECLWWKPIDKPLPKDQRSADLVELHEGGVIAGRIVSRDENAVRIRVGSSGRGTVREIPMKEIAAIRVGRWGDPRLENHAKWARLHKDGLRLREVDPQTGLERPALVLGIEVTGFNERTLEGYYVPQAFGVRTEAGTIQWRSDFIPESKLLLTVYPQSSVTGRPMDVVTRSLPVANEFKSGVFEIDANTAFIDLGELQRMLRMDAAPRARQARGADRYAVEIDPQTGRERLRATESDEEEMEPARVTTVLVRAKDGITPEQLAARCKEIYAQFEADHAGEVPSAPPLQGTGRPPPGTMIIQTWKQQQGTMVAAVEKEILIVLFILLFISVVASFLILAIFWAMVSEKTRDIGVLRALGASRAGVAWLWLRYGLVIGLVGSILGGVVACAIVWNINPIHDWMGQALGLYLWDPKVYYFTEIPHDVEPRKAAIVLAGGLIFSVLGALIPAVRAARMDPVRALRFE